MADQVDFPDIFLDESVSTGGVGSEADPYSDFSEVNWTTGGDNSIFDYYAGTPTASVTLNLQKGEEWRETLDVGTSGVAAYPLLIRGYGSGANPVISGSDLIGDIWSIYSGNVWEAALTTEPNQIFLDGTRATKEDSLVNVNAANEWWWESDTLYVYSASDPYTAYTAPGVEASARDNCIKCGLAAESYKRNYITADGVDITKSNDMGFDICGDYVIAKNFTISDHARNGLRWTSSSGYSCNYCECDTLIAENCLGSGLKGIGFTGWDKNTNCLITDCVLRNNIYLQGWSYDAGGVKWFGVDDSTIRRCECYGNYDGGIRLDGDGNQGGCDDNLIEFNDVYENGLRSDVAYVPQLYIEFSSRNTIQYNLVHDPEASENRANMGADHSGTDDNKFLYNIVWGCTGADGITNRWGADGTIFIGNTLFDNRYGFNLKTVTNVTLRNNIISDCDQYHLDTDPAAMSEIDSDYNCWHGSGYMFRQEGVDTYTFAEWKELSEEDDNSTDSDPLFTDADNNDFTLSSSSPCIDKGQALDAAYKEALLPSSTWVDGVLTGDQGDY